METLEVLGRKIKTSNDLLSVVKTMKSLAAVNIRQYEAAAEAMDEYKEIVDTAWQALFKNRPQLPRKQLSSQAVVLVLGSDQGMCGQFNETIIQSAIQKARSLKTEGLDTIFWTAGERVRAGIEEETEVEEHFFLPSSPAAIGDLMNKIVSHYSQRHENRKMETFIICYNRLERGGVYAPVFQKILPLEPYSGDDKNSKPWPTRCLPLIRMDTGLFFEHLFHQHIFSAIYKAFSQSLASENAARLASMQAAEKNIVEMEETLQSKFRETRQNAITAELLDIISGFEALAPIE
ncbi:MAG: F0F1 ATP synthase subunit gamma [Desulfobulbaceae bacterium]|uniref:F0F1 ATP synthase subunit gamma n=1 Tax=Candidatus Desulfobia pelagia TaxID=2841692 RepID=A0A8J6TB68_9BACT|nr:F0F1 ATP synthase subunit gamma [Candidatus Desulfobia pelagia]